MPVPLEFDGYYTVYSYRRDLQSRYHNCLANSNWTGPAVLPAVAYSIVRRW